jgi:hypothetical protein
MARDYEDIHDLDDMSDEDLVQLVRDALGADDALDADNILVTAHQGVLRLEGRVGTEPERRIAERVITDALGIARLENNLVVDPIRRGEEPEAVDEHLADAAGREDALLGNGPDTQMGPEAEHLVEDRDARLYGTRDVQSSIERGTAWIPPTSPTPEGLSGTDSDSGAAGEDH